MRFRSLGEKGITWPIESSAATLDEIIAELKITKVPERSGRPMGADEDESSFERLRADGKGLARKGRVRLLECCHHRVIVEPK